MKKTKSGRESDAKCGRDQLYYEPLSTLCYAMCVHSEANQVQTQKKKNDCLQKMGTASVLN